MKKKLLTIFILGILIVSGFWILRIFRENTLPTKPTAQDESSIFYETIPIAEFTPADLPCLNIEIEGQKFLALLDLGFSGNISLLSGSLQKIKEKSFIDTTLKWGFRGIEDKRNVYKIPKIEIDNVSFYNLALEEDKESREKEGAILSLEENPRLEVGKLGWLLFNNMTLFLDLGHSSIAICDSIETFKERGYPLTTFTKIPFQDDRNLIEFNAMTPDGPLLCFLDTGCTLNHINTDNPNNESLADLVQNDKNYVNFSTFQIGQKDFGPITFCPLPIRLPIHIEAILGMEFLSDHLVFIDFKNRHIYIAPAEQED